MESQLGLINIWTQGDWLQVPKISGIAQTSTQVWPNWATTKTPPSSNSPQPGVRPPPITAMPKRICMTRWM